MKDESGVRLSEFLDGELNEKELAALIKDAQQPEQQRQLRDFARIGHAMRAESDIYSSIDVSVAVAQAVANIADENSESSESVSPSATGLFTSAWFKPAMGAAFATVVAVFTVMVNQSVTSVTDHQTIPVVAQQQLINPETIKLSQFEQTSEQEVVDLAVREELNNYLVNHARSASGGNYQGMVPYVRAVAYEPDKNQK
ncbi:MAG: RseA family anti-sigma factor [Gammaproteobacteria bacterium]|nr:RseA family anti-sigma factor [Gammaproteobacteria bacterium]